MSALGLDSKLSGDYISSYHPSSALVMEDLIQGMNGWRNIQDIVRLTFKAFHDVVKAQGEAIKSLERGLESKAGRADVTAALQQKADTSEMRAKLRDLEARLSIKADLGDVQKLAHKNEVSCAIQQNIDSMYSHLETKADARALQQQSEAAILKMQKQIEDLSCQLSRKATLVEVAEALQAKSNRAEVLELMHDKVSMQTMGEALTNKAGIQDLQNVESSLRQAACDAQARCASKAECMEVQDTVQALAQRLDRMDARVDNEACTTTSAVRSFTSSYDAMLADVRGSASAAGAAASAMEKRVRQLEAELRLAREQQTEALARKADASDLYKLLDSKADTLQVNEALGRVAGQKALDVLAERMEQAAAVVADLPSLQQQVEAKADIKDVCTLLDVKANVEDVNKALLEVSGELETKAPADELRMVVRSQADINASLCSDMGRWLWKSGKTKAGSSVPWNLQTVNTDPHNLIWEKDKATIVTVVPGLYEVTFGFYAARKPQVQVLVNGDPVLTAVNNSSYVTHHSSGRLTAATNHPAGNVTGLTCIDFLSLPPRAHLAITYQGEERGEGFLSLRKL